MAGSQHPNRFLWMRTLPGPRGIQALTESQQTVTSWQCAWAPGALGLSTHRQTLPHLRSHLSIHGPEDQHFHATRTTLSSDHFPSPVPFVSTVPSLIGFRGQCRPSKPISLPSYELRPTLTSKALETRGGGLVLSTQSS